MRAGPGLDILVAGRAGPGPHNSICGPGPGRVFTTAAGPGRAWASNHICGPGLGLDFRPVQDTRLLGTSTTTEELSRLNAPVSLLTGLGCQTSVDTSLTAATTIPSITVRRSTDSLVLFVYLNRRFSSNKIHNSEIKVGARKRRTTQRESARIDTLSLFRLHLPSLTPVICTFPYLFPRAICISKSLLASYQFPPTPYFSSLPSPSPLGSCECTMMKRTVTHSRYPSTLYPHTHNPAEWSDDQVSPIAALYDLLSVMSMYKITWPSTMLSMFIRHNEVISPSYVLTQ